MVELVVTLAKETMFEGSATVFWKKYVGRPPNKGTKTLNNDKTIPTHAQTKPRKPQSTHWLTIRFSRRNSLYDQPTFG